MDLEKLLVLWQNQSSVSNKYASLALFQTLQFLKICKAGTEVFKTTSAIHFDDIRLCIRASGLLYLLRYLYLFLTFYVGGYSEAVSTLWI